NGRPLGEQWDDWQQGDLRGLVSKQNGVAIRPRGHAKTSDAGSLIVYQLVCGIGQQDIVSVAADLDQAALFLRDVAGKLARNPKLRSLAKCTENLITITATGSTYRVLASDAASAYGLRLTMLTCDEVAEWMDKGTKLWEALYSGMAKIPGAKTIVISSHGGG